MAAKAPGLKTGLARGQQWKPRTQSPGRSPLKPFRHVSKHFDNIPRHGQKHANMSIPGLGQEEPEEEISHDLTGQVKVVDLLKEQEWRFEVALGKIVEVKVCVRMESMHG